ncbi:maltose alpha-D-glucosyltransferase [Plastoroseomonas hellenica]|uniref:maltose alpha-D-glucosyltransferase n=1 Tax=Plastoroseomonas hellenica TaxID=2687306 RepID=UPI001BA67337|nr:maltose alpha-D-glucosyltransferase [Plastoroseomonas hellenica]MBR0642245.1 maltose alpha-D-glucosyltransferase [Plastoroseomonas hellenica]
MNRTTRLSRASATASLTHPTAVDGDPEWYRDAVIYQLHVKSFFDSNDDGIGDFPGLLQKLDYIVELGVNTVWLLPFYPSPRRDDGYDISEYRGIHQDYGTLRDAKRFVQEAHARGLRVITELVINHTSDEHPWFQRARLAKPGSSARDFYVWSETDQRYLDTRIIFLDTEKSNWTWDPVAQAYFWHRFYSHQPDLNFDNPRVLEAVFSVMKFWLDIGVDGLRLDAVPYLIERDGTNNENLPETHAVLRRIRARLDQDYPARMLLAEANQWPEDTQQYFGNGDECHMAFHFPLMPRMYMAIAQEDRFPITDILRQTPDIPAACQWAIFLRNHDELTLEMVTDQERDYLWSTYAADRRARINLGIRRRLAPLLQRDRRRIELMNGLLLSMPGTPVIYYGDEIGMGDNIFLRDRDGVRTPMQWAPDRNGGFSRADPASLVLPPLQDPLYGFQAVNVEAQIRDPHSLLHWMQRILAVRSRSSVFGRGSMRLLYPGNRKVLAYLRELDGSTALCVFNLSRSAQAVELDLSGCAGRVPVEMLGGSIFPPIGQLPYLLTLPPYGFYWFALPNEGALPAWHTPAPEPMPELRTRVFKAPLAEMLEGPLRADLEQNELKEYLMKRRWFSAKDRAVSSARFAGIAAIPGTGGRVAMAEVDVDVGGGTERFCLPLAMVEEAEAISPLPSQLALGRFRLGRRVGFITDAFASDAFAPAVVAALRAGASIPGSDGELRFQPTSLLSRTSLPENAEIRRLSAEQSNSSLVIGDAMVMKIIRRTAPGIHPEVEMTRFLTEAGVEGVAPLLGHAERTGTDGVPSTLLIMQAFVRNQGDGWGWTLDWLRRAMNEAEADHAEAGDPFAGYIGFASAIGRRLAEMHAALARPNEEAAFAPEAATSQDATRWVAATASSLEAAFDALARRDPWDDKETAALAQSLIERRQPLLDALHRLRLTDGAALKTRVHGDFHLGQVLVVQGDAVIVDFEGEPARSLDERRAKTSPMKDVAGLLRSFDYAAAMLPMESAMADMPAPERRQAALDAWQQAATAAFLNAYRAVAEGQPHPWLRASGEQDIMSIFLLEKVAYEIGYEIANRPAWLPVPLRGLDRLARRLLA